MVELKGKGVIFGATLTETMFHAIFLEIIEVTVYLEASFVWRDQRFFIRNKRDLTTGPTVHVVLFT